jgi:4-amino-4-deoxy-L-arabinose transferase-like glycosyltransferase
VRKHAPIVLILAIAALARFWAIDFGLPSPLCRPDEEAVVSIAVSAFSRHYNPNFFDWPTLFMYMVAISMVPLFKIGRWIGWFRSEFHFFQVITSSYTPVIVHARVVSAAMGVLSVWLLYRIARRLFDQTAALVAALFLALAFLHARDSHFGVTDVSATAFVLASFLFVVRFRESSLPRDFFAAAVFAGLATSTKYNAAVVALPALWVVLSPERPEGGPWLSRIGRAVLFGFVMATAFVLTTPYSVIEFNRFASALRGVSAHLAIGHGVMLGRGWGVHLASSLRHGIGEPMLVAGLAGLALLVIRQRRKGIIVAIFPVVYYGIIGGGYTVFARYILPVVPFLCLAAAYAVREAGDWLAARLGRPARSAMAAWGLALIVVAPSAWSLVQFDWLLGQTDSRVLVARWIEVRFPAGARIAEMGPLSTHLHFWPSGIGALVPHQHVELSPGVAEPDILVVPTSPRDPGFRLPAEAVSLAARYELRFAVVAYDVTARGNVYDWQDEFYLPVAGFNGIRRPGPNLAIYVRPGFSGLAR